MMMMMMMMMTSIKIYPVYCLHTCTGNAISKEITFALALEVTISVGANCIRVTVVSVLNTFVHICIKVNF